MLGAIIGDIVGSAYEFNPTHDYNLELFTAGSDYTDDTICTIALADALLSSQAGTSRTIDYSGYLHSWCRRYPNPKGGYGGRFAQWVRSSSPEPYGSFGNGSAMRVSAIGMWFHGHSERAVMEAECSAECTHNHPEGIKGAAVVALAISRTIERGADLTDETKIKTFCRQLRDELFELYDYPAQLNYEDYRGRFNETCQGTVPVALDIIAKSHSFEDAIRRAVSLAADADTLGAIVGSIAEHIWGIPEMMKRRAMTYLTPEMRGVVRRFYEAYASNSCNVFQHYEDVEQEQLYFSTGGRTGLLPDRTTPERIDRLHVGEIFVFGSNAQGHHAGGAARAALDKFGAVWGQGDGLQGRSYAISTMEGLVSTARNVERFITFAAKHPELRFLVTPIGCGIAGYNPLQIAPLFRKAIALPNVFFPRSFWEYFWIIKDQYDSHNLTVDWRRWDH